MLPLVWNRKLFPSLGPSSLNYISPTRSFYSWSEAVFVCSFLLRRLKRPFHCSLFFCQIIRAANVDKFGVSANGLWQLEEVFILLRINNLKMKLTSVFALVSIFSIIVGGVLQGLDLPFGRVLVFLGVGILIFIYIPLFLVELSRNK